MENTLHFPMHSDMLCIRKNGVSFIINQKSSDMFHIFTLFMSSVNIFIYLFFISVAKVFAWRKEVE